MNELYLGIYSGLISTFVCNPFDVIRTHKQLSIKYEIKLNYSGLKSLYRGIIPGLITIPTFWGIYFPTYNYLKQCDNLKNSNFSFLFGYISCNIASTITCPLWFIRQKYQISNSSNSSGSSNFRIIDTFNKQGIKPFYNALIPTYIINMSFIIQIPLYEYLKNNNYNFIRNYSNSSNSSDSSNYSNYSTINTFINSSISKTCAAICTYPLDTIRTIRRNTNKSFYDIILKLNNKPSNYYNGLGIYLIRSIPYHSSVWCSYEYFKQNYK